MPVELIMEDDRWRDLGLQELADRACDTALRQLALDPAVCEIGLLACDNARIAALNDDFRGKAQPTNVLSWPALDLSPQESGAAPRPPRPDFSGVIGLGDIAIARETCAREALEAGKPLADHVAHLIVHGLLHLLGYDHVRDPDATLMEALETRILGRMGIDDPYMEDNGP
ncbi:MAG: rRNA maturation RNase YbeY [Jhaorihella sp.]